MQPTYISIAQLFGAQTRHTVPLFQRPYVWTQEDQWEPLWEDIVGLLDRLGARQGEAAVASHFLGTIVLEQTPNSTGSLPRREVIDGQQRLTTLQIVLKSAEHALADLAKAADKSPRQSIEFAQKQIASLTENLAEAEEERYKVWPTNEDRASFRHVLDSTLEDGVNDAAGRMAACYRFFRSVFTETLAKGDGVQRARLLAAALKDYLKLIVLDLDPSDEPQAIFETLNAHGTPLLPADLMKNWLLWEAARQKIDATPLYDKHWRAFDREHDYWRMRVGTGHAARARIDTFLQNWLAKETIEQVSAKHLYDRFLRYASAKREAAPDGKLDVRLLMERIRADADLYERIDKPSGNSRFDRFLERLQTMSLIVFHPLLLVIMDRARDKPEQLDAVAVVLESYLVRRMVCNLQTRGYGTLAMELLRAILAAPDAPMDAVLSKVLLSNDAGTDAWPDDDKFRTEWSGRKFYNGLRRDRVLMLLRALEEVLQQGKHLAEPLMTFDWAQLQIEHVMPQSWLEHWPLRESVTADQRNWAIQGIGNLTLVSGKLNPTLSNAPWLPHKALAGKMATLKKHTRLELNRLLLESYPEWNDASIRERAQELFQTALQIWPTGTITEMSNTSV